MLPISMGATGAAVEDVQRRLRALGRPVADEIGVYGQSTDRAVRLFQQDRRLVADGIVGPDTWTALVDASMALGDRLLYLTAPFLRGDDVAELQRSLSRLGFDTGSADGIHGPLTDAALRDFQHNIGVVVDGISGETTLHRLRSLRRHHQATTSFEVLERHDTTLRREGLVGLRVLLDPAGGPGKPGPSVHGLSASDITLDIARRLRGMLAANGAHPILSRSGTATPSTSERAQLANDTEQDLIVSIACGAVDQPGAQGVAAHHFGDGTVGSQRGQRLAELCVDELVTATDAPDCQAHASTSTILRESRAPAVVVEVGFVTNAQDAALLATPAHRHTIATALLAAIRRSVTEPADTPAVAIASR